MPRTVNDATRALTRGFETFVPYTYDDARFPPVPARADIPVTGTLTIGYGQTGAVASFGAICTRDQAEAWFEDSLAKAAAIVERDAGAAALTDNQFGALTDFVFNCGIGNFEVSTLLKDLLSGDLADVPSQIQRWDNAGGRISQGLDRRRTAEIALWNTADSTAAAPAESPSPAIAGEGGDARAAPGEGNTAADPAPLSDQPPTNA
jgi:lysozyme